MNNKGQALLLVLLAMATLATMALSVVSRSVSEVSVSTREEESLRAFSAAEAGIEEALVTGTQAELIAGNLPPISNSLTVTAPSGSSEVSNYTVAVGRYPENPQQFAYPFDLFSGQAGSVWFVTRNGNEILNCTSGECFTGNTLTLCWGIPGSPEPPAAVVNLFYESGGNNYALTSAGYDPEVSRRPSNNFVAPDSSSGSCTVAGKNFTYSKIINFSDLGIVAGERPILMRVAMLYNQNVPHTFGVAAGSALPVQGRSVDSEGVSGESTRRINAFLLNPEIPFIFDAAVYSPENIAK